MASGTIKAVIASSDIVDNLTTNDATKVLSAKQGKVLNDQIATLTPTITTLTLQNGWTDNGGNYILKSGNVVTLHIGCRYGTMTAGTVITNIPSGARPSQNVYVPAVTNTSSAILLASTNGDVSIADGLSSNSYLYACVTFVVGN